MWNSTSLKLIELEFIAGRDFDASNLADSSSVILNEAASQGSESAD